MNTQIICEITITIPSIAPYTMKYTIEKEKED